LFGCKSTQKKRKAKIFGDKNDLALELTDFSFSLNHIVKGTRIDPMDQLHNFT